MNVQPKKPSIKGPAEWFTGDVWIDGIAQGEEPSRGYACECRALHPGRPHRLAFPRPRPDSVRHRGCRGLVQSRGGEIATIRSGDVIRTPGDEWHWHALRPITWMSHLSITEGVADGQRPETDWGEHVTDAEYRSRGQ